MQNRGINRRTFLKYSAGALAVAVASPVLAGRVRARDAKTLRVGTWDPASEIDIENQVLQAFNQAHPDVTVTFEPTPDQYDTKIITGLAGGNAPDTFLWWNYPQLTVRNGLQDLTPYLTGSNPLDTSIYYQQIIDYSRSNGALWGLPKDFTSRAYFYNKKLFDDAGIPYPTNDWTWDDLQRMAIALTHGDGPDKVFGYYNYSGTYPLQGYVWSNGGDFISPDGTTATGYLDSDATIAALDWYVRLQTEHGVSPTSTQEATVGGPGDLFQNGKLAIFDNGRWPESQFKGVAGLDFGTVLPPKAPTGNLVTVLHQAGWAMNPAAADKDLAWDLVKWLAGPQAHRIRAEAGWAIPAIPAVTDELNLLADPVEKTWFDAVPFATVLPDFMRNPNWPAADTEIANAISAAFLGQTPIADGLKAAAPVVDGILQGS